MDILNNPFFILGASVFDPQAKLSQLAQTKSKSLNQKLVQQSYGILSNPKLRLQAEIAWVYNFSYSVLNKQLQQKLEEYQKQHGSTSFVPYSSVNPVTSLQGYPCPIKRPDVMAKIVWPAYEALYGAACNGLGALSAINILLPLFRCNWKPATLDPSQNKPADLIATVIRAFDDINLGAVGELINQTRKQAKFPPVSMGDLQQAFENHKNYIMQLIMQFFDKLQSGALPEYVNNLELYITEHGQSHMSSRLLIELLGQYEAQTADYFVAQKKTLQCSLNYWAVAENDQLPDPQVLYYVNCCLKQARGWMHVLKPLNTWVQLHASLQVAHAQKINDPEQQQMAMQQIQYHHSKVDELFALVRDYLSYVPHLGNEIVRHNVLDSFKQVFGSDPQCISAFMQVDQVISELERDELKELQAGLESPEICNYSVQVPLPLGVDEQENHVSLTNKTIEFQQQLMSIKRILSFWVEKVEKQWVVFVVFEHGAQWRLAFDECLVAFVLAHQLSLVLLEYKFSVWMNRLRNHIPLNFSPAVIHANKERLLDGGITSVYLRNDGLEFQVLPRDPARSTPVNGFNPKPKVMFYTWKQLDIKRSVQEMSWSVLKIYPKQESMFFELKYSVPNFRLLCCLLMAIQDNQTDLLTDYVKGSNQA